MKPQDFYMKLNLICLASLLYGLAVAGIFSFPKTTEPQYLYDSMELAAPVDSGYVYVPTPTPLPTATPTPTPIPTPTTPVEILTDESVSYQEFYDACLLRGMISGVNEDDHITAERGGCMGPSGRETYYNLRMDNCVNYMRELGYDEEEYPYWIRDDGAKMLGLYVMCAANWKIRPKGTIIPTSLGDAIVVDTGEFVADFPYGVDLAVDWR